MTPARDSLVRIRTALQRSPVLRESGAGLPGSGAAGLLVAATKDVTFPRDDVLALRERVDGVENGAKVLENKAEEQYAALAEVRRTLDALGVTVYTRADDADRRITALGREFEATVNRLTDNQEIITGLKAFLRLLRAGDGVGGAGGVEGQAW